MYPSVNFLYTSIRIIPSYACYNIDRCPFFSFDIHTFYDYQQETNDLYLLDTQFDSYNNFFRSVQ